MEFQTITKESFKVIGISVRTTNGEVKAAQDLTELWSRFFTEGIIENIQNKVDTKIYCIYSDYESDFTGEYTAYIGCQVSSFDNLPEGFAAKEIPQLEYQVFQAKGVMPNCIQEAWMEIWNSGMERSYIADFEVYDERAQNPQDAIVDIYLS